MHNVTMQNALTIDLEDWYQGLTSTGRQPEQWPIYEARVVANTERLLTIFAAAKVQATFFVLGYVADHFPALVRQVADQGHEIALHGYSHQHVGRLTPAQFRDDVERGQEAVQAASNRRPRGFRAPMFSINGDSLWALELLRELGFDYDSSVFPTRNPLYGYPQAPRFPYHPFAGDPFVEFPLAVTRVMGLNWPVAGGFYLRLLPYPLLKWGLQRLNQERIPAVIYLHPWDLDTGQPRLNPTLRERFTHYHNRQSSEQKLLALLRDFRFAPLQELLTQTDPTGSSLPAENEERPWLPA